MKPVRCSLLFLALSLTACASHRQKSDGWCPALSTFGNAQLDTAPHTVVLNTSWMSSSDVLASRHCEANGYDPGQRLCSFLLKNAAVEYPQDNLHRALRCLATGGYAPPDNAFIESRHVIYTFYDMPEIDDAVKLTIEYKDGQLTITSERIEE